MLTAKAKQRANQQIRALIEIGTPKPEAISMIARGTARRIRKSLPGEVDDRPLPTVDTSAADRRREEQEKEQRQKPAEQSGKAKDDVAGKYFAKIAALQRKKPKAPAPAPRSVQVGTILRTVYPDGRLRLSRVTGWAKTPYFTPAEWQKYLSLKRKKPVKLETIAETTTPDQKGAQPVMQKSKKLETLIAAARNNPAKLTDGTKAAINAYLTKNGQPPIVTPMPKITFGRMTTLTEIAQLRQHERDTTLASAQAPVAGPGLKQSRMSVAEVQQHRLQQALDAQKESAKPKPPETGMSVSWLGR